MTATAPPVTVEALPVPSPGVGAARPIMPSRAFDDGSVPGLPVQAGTDSCAVASAVCGITAIIPIVCQVLGLSLGIAGLLRIRRARRRGIDVRGGGWAVTGIVSSGLALLGWLAVFALLGTIGSSLAQTNEALNAIALPAG